VILRPDKTVLLHASARWAILAKALRAPLGGRFYCWSMHVQRRCARRWGSSSGRIRSGAAEELILRGEQK
jgi:hypothetical protein